MGKLVKNVFCNVAIALVALSAATGAVAQRVDSTKVNKLVGAPPSTPSAQSVVNSLQNSSSKNVEGWKKESIQTFDLPVISGVLDTVAGKVVISGQVAFSYVISSNTPGYVKLYRDGTLLKSWPISGVASPIPGYAGPDSNQPIYSYAFGGSIPVNYVDLPGAGSHTYSVQVQGGWCCEFTTFNFDGGSLVLWQ